MGAGAGVYQCNIGAIVDYYTAKRGYLVKDGRLVDYYIAGRWGDQAALINDRAARHAAELNVEPDRESDETTGINYDTDSPYEEAYDGDMEDDHPMVEAMRGGTNPNADDHEMVDGWMTPEENTTSSSEPWEPITNTRGHDREHDPYNWDWIPDFGTESDEPCVYPRDLRSRGD